MSTAQSTVRPGTLVAECGRCPMLSAFVRSREAANLLCLHLLYLTPFENVPWQKLWDHTLPRPSPQEVACQRYCPGLCLFLLNSFANYTISSHFSTVCSLLFSGFLPVAAASRQQLWWRPPASQQCQTTQVNRSCASTPPPHTCKGMLTAAGFSWGDDSQGAVDPHEGGQILPCLILRE